MNKTASAGPSLRRAESGSWPSCLDPGHVTSQQGACQQNGTRRRSERAEICHKKPGSGAVLANAFEIACMPTVWGDLSDSLQQDAARTDDVNPANGFRGGSCETLVGAARGGNGLGRDSVQPCQTFLREDRHQPVRRRDILCRATGRPAPQCDRLGDGDLARARMWQDSLKGGDLRHAAWWCSRE